MTYLGDGAEVNEIHVRYRYTLYTYTECHLIEIIDSGFNMSYEAE